MLTSDRQFGLEIEFATETMEELQRIQRKINVVHDGSLRPLRYAGEYVSRPLSGDKGQQEVIRVCEILKNGGASCSSPKTSMHVHIDGLATGGVLRASRTLPDVDTAVYGFSNKLKNELGKANILAMVNGGNLEGDIPPYSRTIIDGVRYFSKAELIRKPRLNYTYYYLEKPDRFHWLRNSFYFYTLFSTVMESMVSNSRKCDNMYCIPLARSYNTDDIAKLKDMSELKAMWYKDTDPRQRYNDSRYRDVNLHSFWDKHGTLEIRSHGGTTDPMKVLLWVRLHQTIADKLETVEFDELKLMKGTEEEFVSFLEDDMLGEYVKRLIGFYSKNKTK